MLRKLGRKITNNFGLKLLAALFAVVLWVVVINIDDPTKAQSFTTSVIVENQEYLTGLNKYFEVLDGKNTVTFNASAERSVLTEMTTTEYSDTTENEKNQNKDKNAN